jgi:hypothetical protein
MNAASGGNRVMGVEASTDSQAQESSDHSETLSKRVSDQGGGK